MKRTIFFSAILCITVLISLITASQTSAGDPLNGRLLPPVILSPKEISEFRDANMIEVKWLQMPGAAKYHLVLATDRKFKKIAQEKTGITYFHHMIRDLDYGTYFLKLSSVSSDGAEGPFSDTVSFIIAPSPPSPIPLK